MFTFSVSDSFYRFNCSPNMSPLSDSSDAQHHEKSNLLILPYSHDCCQELLENGYSLLDTTKQRVIFFIPTYNYCSDSLMIFPSDVLANINTDVEELGIIREKYSLISEDFVFEYEEILKEHLEFLNQKYPDIKVIPILYNNIMEGIVTEILNNYIDNSSFIFLSNLSSGFNYNDAFALDRYTAARLEANQAADISFERFSGFKILPELLNFVQERGSSFIRLGIYNSGDFSPNLASTKGYGAWFLYNGSTCEYVKRYYSDEIIRFIIFNLKNDLHVACGECFNFPEVFSQEFKVFVSLEKDGFVRGVSGSMKKQEPLFKALVKRAFGAAFSDNRFAPLKADELDSLKIYVTLICKDLMEAVLIES